MANPGDRIHRTGLLLLALSLTAAAPRASRPPAKDILPPALVTNLSAGIRTMGSMTLSWSAPGDDGLKGRAAEYDVRHATVKISEANWDSAAVVSGEPAPKAAGGAESFTVTGLSPGTLYYFALKTRDEIAGHWSPLSRVTRGATPPLVGQMVLVEPGAFLMGSPKGEPERHGRERPHQVTLTRGFLICDHEVTQGEWRAVMGVNPSEFTGDDERPVESVSWFDAIEYCNRRSALELLAPAYVISEGHISWDRGANGYRLPTEAEWEYACRAGTTTAFASGGLTRVGCTPVDPSLDVMGWYCGNAGDATHRMRQRYADRPGPYDMSHAVRQKAANAWGLFDMHGNVTEWCWDVFGEYVGPVTDPLGPAAGLYRVVRGGSRYYDAQFCRSANRTGADPAGRVSLIGLRVARTAP